MKKIKILMASQTYEILIYDILSQTFDIESHHFVPQTKIFQLYLSPAI